MKTHKERRCRCCGGEVEPEELDKFEKNEIINEEIRRFVSESIYENVDGEVGAKIVFVDAIDRYFTEDEW